MTAASPLRGPKSMEGGGFAAAHLPGAPRRLRGRFSGLKGASRFLRKWPAATLDPGDLGGPWGRKSGQAQGLPRPGARRAGLAGGCGYLGAREQVNWRSITRKEEEKLHKCRLGHRVR